MSQITPHFVLSRAAGQSFQDLLDLDAEGEDWEQYTDQELEALFEGLTNADPDLPKGETNKLCGAQKCWLARRHDNWTRGNWDHNLRGWTRAEPLWDSATKTGVKRSEMARTKLIMAIRIKARSQALGREWNRLTRLTED